MKALYRAGLSLVNLILPVLALSGSKMRKFYQGRQGIMSGLREFKQQYPERPIWFHVASLGEFEQAKPVISLLKKREPNRALVVSFFSPSGYEPAKRKPNEDVDFITYLPLDTRAQAEEFVGTLDPYLAVFVKYDLWYEHIMELKQRQVPIFLISALFRANQNYFKSDGFFRNLLRQLDHIFTQNEESAELLRSIGYESYTVAGDTRFDRVLANAQKPMPFPVLSTWIAERDTVVLGSVWEEDMEILIPLINQNPGYRWIIAPHDLNPEKMRAWADRITLRSDYYTTAGWNESPNVLFLDTIGMLSSVYQFAKIAYVGGAFGSGLHNILEPIGFGVPVIFGKIRLASKFPEGKISQSKGCGFEVRDTRELREVFQNLEQPEHYSQASEGAKAWLHENQGAAVKICDQVNLILKQHER
ncbi:3-deoxy-D-manno-octulosonic acid transferase [Algoriphagus namhaensis]